MVSKFSDEIFLAHGGDDNHKEGQPQGIATTSGPTICGCIIKCGVHENDDLLV